MLTEALLIYDTMRASVPTLVEGILGRIDPDAIDERILRWSSDCVRHAGLELTVENAGDVDWSRSYVVMTNHQSYLDIPAIAVALRGRVRFVAKKELFRIPVFGPAMKAAGIVRLDRGNREAAIASLREAAETLRAGGGRHIWIAPEGTRSRNGELGPLKKGGFMLAADTGAPILPAAVVGTREAMPPQGFRVRRGVRARVAFGRPIETAGRPRDELVAEVEGCLREKLR